MISRRDITDTMREVALQLRLHVRDGAPLTLTVMFPAVGMMLIQYLHRGAVTPLPGRDIERAIDSFRNGDLSGWTPFAPYGAAAGIVLALSVVCLAHLAIGLATAREQGLLKHVRAMPIASGAYLSAQLMVSTLLGTAAALLTLGISIAAFGVVVLPGQWPALIAVIVAGAAAFSLLGIAASNTIVRATTGHAQVYLMLLPMLFLSSVFSAPQLLIADMRAVGVWLPMQPLTTAVFTMLATDASAPPVRELAKVGAWAVPAIAALRWFRWMPAQNSAH